MEETLKPADILLYSSTTWIGWLIKKLDGTDVTHAGLYLGDGRVAEALMVGSAGLNANPLKRSIAGSTWVDAYRLQTHGIDMGPVLQVAHNYLQQGNRYAYGEILLVAAVCVTRKLDLANPFLRRVVLVALQKANDMIERIFDRGREPMICSEFVFRCYDEADPAMDDPYSITVLSQQAGAQRTRFSSRRLGKHVFSAKPEQTLPTVHPESVLGRILESEDESLLSGRNTATMARQSTPTSDKEFEDLIQQYADSLDTKATSSGASSTLPVDDRLIEAEAIHFAELLARENQTRFRMSVFGEASTSARIRATIADFVTPGDLLRSPSLTRVGRIYE